MHFLPKKHCFWPKKALFFKFTKVLGFGKTPPPCWEKFPNNIVFFYESVPKICGWTLPPKFCKLIPCIALLHRATKFALLPFSSRWIAQVQGTRLATHDLVLAVWTCLKVMYAKNLISGDVAFDILVKHQRAATDDGKLELKLVRGKFLLFPLLPQ